MVQQNVKAEDLEAGGAAVVGGEAGAVVVPEDCMGRHQCLDDYILHKMTGERGSGRGTVATDSPWFCSAEL